MENPAIKSNTNTSPGLSLGHIDVSDADHLMSWAGDDRASRWCTWDTYTSIEQAIEYIETTVKSHPYYRAICINDTPVGAISVSSNSGNDKCRGELGYVIASKYWGKGIATWAVKAVAATIFDEWPHLERLEALVDVENPGSQRVLEKAGFIKEGVLRKYYVLKGRTRDMVMFSLVSTDPKPR